ncbi:MAG: hypothetical protein JJU03_04380 [Idiomarina sp.]|nr:hypothetical protein [Idiomarina sp.]
MIRNLSEQGVIAVVKKSNKIHDRYKVEILSQDNLVRTLGIPASRPRVRVVEIVRRELRTASTSTHATIRALDGTEHVIYAKDNWLLCQLKAFKL